MLNNNIHTKAVAQATVQNRFTLTPHVLRSFGPSKDSENPAMRFQPIRADPPTPIVMEVYRCATRRRERSKSPDFELGSPRFRSRIWGWALSLLRAPDGGGGEPSTRGRRGGFLLGRGRIHERREQGLEALSHPHVCRRHSNLSRSPSILSLMTEGTTRNGGNEGKFLAVPHLSLAPLVDRIDGD